VLQRLLAFQSAEPLGWHLQWHPERAAARVWVQAGTTWLASAVGATPREALAEALGGAISRLQTGRGSCAAPPAADAGAALPPLDHGAHLPAPPARWCRVAWAGVPASVYLGWAELEATS
jgi:hypothetical protein